MVGFVSDGAVHMIGKNNGTAAKLKNKVKECLQCIHEEALCRVLENELHSGHIKTVKFICASALNHHYFVALLENVKSEYSETIYHSDIRWLSHRVCCERLQGNCTPGVLKYSNTFSLNIFYTHK
jgi:hypothetical protein